MAGGIRLVGLRCSGGFGADTRRGRPAILAVVDASTWERLALAPRVVPPADPVIGHGLVLAAIRDGAIVSVALEGTLVVGLALAGPTDQHARREVLALGVAPEFRRRGLAGALLDACVTAGRPGDVDHTVEVTLAERDPVEPLERDVRARSRGVSWSVPGSIRRRSTAASAAPTRRRSEPSARRSPASLARSSPRPPPAGEAVSEAVFGRDVGLAGRGGLELDAQVADRHPQQVDIDVVAGAPHGAEDLAVRDELAGVFDEVGEEPEFGRRQPDLLAAEASPVLVEIDRRGRDAGAGAGDPGWRSRRGGVPPRPAQSTRGSSAAW